MGATGSKLEKALEDQFPEGERYFGLENFRNTCYCNSVLQNYSKDPHAKGGDSLTDVEKTKSNGSVLNRAKKRQLKGNVGATWRKLISQCAQLWCNS